MKRILLLSLCTLVCCTIFAQQVTLTFTGKDANNNWCPLDRVVISNLTRGWQETINWPDTTLTMQSGTSISEYAADVSFSLSQNTPNPFNGITDVNLTATEAGSVAMEVTDVNGHLIAAQNVAITAPGTHQFRINVSNAGVYFLTARQNGKTSSVKMVNNGNGTENSIKYAGSSFLMKAGTRGNTSNPFSFGDQMEYVGYATIDGNTYESNRIVQIQGSSQSFILHFNAVQHVLTCPGAPTLTDVDGNTYHTVQIGNQCWMKENLRTTKYADNTTIALGSSNSIVTPYRYYPDGNISNVPTYGYLYNWKAVMRNSSSSQSNPSGVQGICPTGWHVPSVEEWFQLANYVKSQSEFVCDGCTVGDASSWWFDCIAKALSSTTGWENYTGYNSSRDCFPAYNPSGNDATGFKMMPAGYFPSDYNGEMADFSKTACIWSATSYDYSYTNSAKLFTTTYDEARLTVTAYPDECGASVRCVRN